METLRIKAWNIHGNKHKVCGQTVSKFHDCDFIQQVKGFDICGLLETHASPDTNIDIDGT